MQDFLGSDNASINSTFIDNLTNESFAEQKIHEILKADYIVPETCHNQSLGAQNIDNNDWLIYPNPFNRHFNVKTLINNTSQPTSFVLTNQFGQTVYRGDLKFINGAARVYVPSLNTGVYILTLKNTYKTRSFKLLGGVQ